MELRGLHHLTAVTGNPSVNVGFYTEVLGLRLVKKTVNQDDVSAYHLFYGDGIGHPGTEIHLEQRRDITEGRVGIGGVHHVAFRTPDDTEHAAWRKRLADAGVGVTPIINRFSFHSIYFQEPGARESRRA
jgi:glyoxalase family protein